MNKSRGRVLGLGIVVGLVIVLSASEWGRAENSVPPPPTISYGELLAKAQAGAIASVEISGDQAVATYKDKSRRLVTVPPDTRLSDRLVSMNVDVSAVPRVRPGLLAMLLAWLPMMLMMGLLLWSARAASGRGAFSMGKSRIKRHDPSAVGRVGFGDVAGIGQAKDDLAETVQFLKDPERFQRLGARAPRGILLIGPPGTGKTLLARAIAGEAGVPFFATSGSDFVEMFVGIGASRVRDMFEQAKKAAPCIIFIDEIDAMGRQRGGAGFGNDEREQTLNQMLVEMDGFTKAEGVVLIAATNRPDVLDQALLRPGRFDRQVHIPNPDIIGREAILHVHMGKVTLAPSVDTVDIARVLARGTPGFSGADLANLVNEGAILAARRGAHGVETFDFEHAKDRIMLGAERRSLSMTALERKMTAYHEAAHALCAELEPDSDPVHKATIVPRGGALGLVLRLPETDRVSLSLKRLRADLTVAMAGRVAEGMVFGTDNITTGAQSDIQMATSFAHRMVTEWGFSDKLGTVHYPGAPHDSRSTGSMSEATAQLIDEEVRRIVAEATFKARAHLVKENAALHRIAAALQERETLDGPEIRALVKNPSNEA